MPAVVTLLLPPFSVLCVLFLLSGVRDTASAWLLHTCRAVRRLTATDQRKILLKLGSLRGLLVIAVGAGCWSLSHMLSETCNPSLSPCQNIGWGFF